MRSACAACLLVALLCIGSAGPALANAERDR